MKHPTSLFIALSLVSLTGCGRLFIPALFAAGATAAIVANSEPRVVVVQEVPIEGPPMFEDGPQQRAPSADPAPTPTAPPAPVGLDPEAARAAIESVDIAECWVPGSTHGSGAARITFGPAGNVQLVELMNPVEGARVDSPCLSRKYNALRIPPFSGKPVVITGKIYVG